MTVKVLRYDIGRADQECNLENQVRSYPIAFALRRILHKRVEFNISL